MLTERTAAVAREVLSQGPVSAVSCVGVGSGSMRWSEEELKRLELGVVGAFHFTNLVIASGALRTVNKRGQYS